MARNLWFLFYLALDLSLSSRHQKVIKWQLLLFKMVKLSLKQSHYSLNTHFEWEKLSFVDFLLTTSKRQVESKRKKKPQIPRRVWLRTKFLSPLWSSRSKSLFSYIVVFYKSSHIGYNLINFFDFVFATINTKELLPRGSPFFRSGIWGLVFLVFRCSERNEKARKLDF